MISNLSRQLCDGQPTFGSNLLAGDRGSDNILRVQNEQFSEEKGFILRYTEKEV